MNDGPEQKLSVSVPLAAIAAAVLLGLAAAAYALTNQDESLSDKVSKVKPSKGLGRKIGLRTFITLLENDATRKVLIAALKAISRRS
ncbi:MAG: hypothetical protein ACR2JC_00050 [Chloroflexota bacterium]|nr:MAG: hypothetical protein DLM70_07235 [Chloroflexota bacterium]